MEGKYDRSSGNSVLKGSKEGRKKKRKEGRKRTKNH
jgi:hypothetical protein